MRGTTINNVTLVGNITRDPEIKEIKVNGNPQKITNFVLAVPRYYTKNNGEHGKEVTYIRLEAWASGAQALVHQCTKGTKLFVEGSLKNESWVTDSGDKKHITKVRVSKFVVLDSAPSPSSHYEQYEQEESSVGD